MKPFQILRIDSSTRVAGSHSRALADSFIAHLRRARPEAVLNVRDLELSPLPHLNERTVAGIYGGESSPGLELSDRLIAEVMEADVVVLSVPLYNFSVPSGVKAWIDHLVRFGRTFAMDPATGAFSGLVGETRFVICASYGVAGYLDGAMRSMDFLQPYLRAVFEFIGVRDVTVFAVEGTVTSPETLERTRASALAQIAAWPVEGGRVFADGEKIVA